MSNGMYFFDEAEISSSLNVHFAYGPVERLLNQATDQDGAATAAMFEAMMARALRLAHD